MNGIEKGDSSTSPVENVFADLAIKEVEQLKDYYIEEAKRLMVFLGKEEEDALFFMEKHLWDKVCVKGMMNRWL